MEFQVKYFFFLINRQLWVVLDGSLYKNIQLMMEFFNVPFLIIHFSYYTLIIFHADDTNL